MAADPGRPQMPAADPGSPEKPATAKKGRRGWSLRTRLVLLATVGLAVGLIVGGVALTVLLRTGLERASDEESRQTAQDIAVLVDAGRLPDPLPAGGTTLVQVVDRLGRVLAASAGADRLVPAVSADQLSAAVNGPVTVPGAQFGVLGPVRVIALPAGSASDPSTVLVGSPAGDIDDAVRVVRTAVFIGFVLLLTVLAAVLWLFVGATLRPVEALRAGAEKITGANSTDTLPLPDSADEIRRLAETLNDMLARLEVSRKRQRAFVADAAHELRSPLTSLRTQLEVAAATGDEPDSADLVAEVDRLTELVEDLLLLARVDDGKPPQRQLLDLGELIRKIAKRYAAARVPVVVQVADAPAVLANLGSVTRALANLLDNAVRYATTQVTVTVGRGSVERGSVERGSVERGSVERGSVERGSVERGSVGSSTDGAALVVISDDGPGIPIVDRERVFERFARLQDARDRDSGGSGLGLAIVRGLIAQQGGSVTLSDTVPGADPPGLTVLVGLPAGPPPVSG